MSIILSEHSNDSFQHGESETNCRRRLHRQEVSPTKVNGVLVWTLSQWFLYWVADIKYLRVGMLKEWMRRVTSQCLLNRAEHPQLNILWLKIRSFIHRVVEQLARPTPAQEDEMDQEISAGYLPISFDSVKDLAGLVGNVRSSMTFVQYSHSMTLMKLLSDARKPSLEERSNLPSSSCIAQKTPITFTSSMDGAVGVFGESSEEGEVCDLSAVDNSVQKSGPISSSMSQVLEDSKYLLISQETFGKHYCELKLWRNVDITKIPSEGRANTVIKTFIQKCNDPRMMAVERVINVTKTHLVSLPETLVSFDSNYSLKK